MKKSRLFPILFLSIFVLATISFKANNKKIIAVVFNKEMTKRDLYDLQKNLKAKNIELVFNKIRFSRNKLTYIDFSIDFGDGYSGTSKSEISKTKEIGFVRDYNENAEEPFVIGEIK